MVYVFNIELGKKLKDLRESCDLSQQQVADRIGVERSTLAGWEVGRREIKISQLIKYCDVCNADPYELLESVRKYVYKK